MIFPHNLFTKLIYFILIIFYHSLYLSPTLLLNFEYWDKFSIIGIIINKNEDIILNVANKYPTSF